jgi:hypothetical protein
MIATQFKPHFHHVGHKITAKTLDEVLTQAHLNWTTSIRPILTPTIPQNKKIPDIKLFLIKNEVMQCPNNFAIVRDDINYTFTTVGNQYTVLDNKICLSIVEDLINNHNIQAERAGVFNFGSSCWVLCRIQNDLEIGPLTFAQYIKIAWSHDATERLTARFLYVLANGKQPVISPDLQNLDTEISIRHTEHAKSRVMEASKIVEKQTLHAAAFEQTVNSLLNTECLDIMEYLFAIFPKAKHTKKTVSIHGKETFEPESQSAENIVSSLKQDYDNLDATVEGTLWGAFSVIANYADDGKTPK